MKINQKQLLCFLFFTCFIACEDDKPLDVYGLDASLIPLSTLSSASMAVYSDNKGNLKEFTIDLKEEIVKKKVDGEDYAVEEIHVDLNNPSETYHLTIQASAEKIGDIITESVIARLFTRASFIEIPTIIINEQGQAIDCDKLGSLTLYNKTFQGVYRNSENENIAYKYIYYNTELGIIGFTDEEGLLWVLENYK